MGGSYMCLMCDRDFPWHGRLDGWTGGQADGFLTMLSEWLSPITGWWCGETTPRSVTRDWLRSPAAWTSTWRQSVAGGPPDKPPLSAAKVTEGWPRSEDSSPSWCCR